MQYKNPGLWAGTRPFVHPSEPDDEWFILSVHREPRERSYFYRPVLSALNLARQAFVTLIRANPVTGGVFLVAETAETTMREFVSFWVRRSPDQASHPPVFDLTGKIQGLVSVSGLWSHTGWVHSAARDGVAGPIALVRQC